MIRMAYFATVALTLLLILPHVVGAATYTPSVSAGRYFGSAIRSDGSLFTWGSNANTALGYASSSPQLEPKQVNTTKFTQVSAGYDHALAIDVNGSLWSWGNGSSGKLGQGSESNHPTPTLVNFDNGAGSPGAWKAISAGINHSVAIASDGSLWGWGSAGLTGDGTTTSRSVPTQVMPGYTWKSVSAGYDYTLALRSDDTLWAWGENGPYGQLGNGGVNTVLPAPVQVIGNWRAASAGRGLTTGTAHSLAIGVDGRLYGWGYSVGGQAPASTTPALINSDSDWVKVASGYGSSAALKSDGSLWTWGSNSGLQLGHGTQYTSVSTPTQLMPDEKWSDVSIGADYMLALREDGSYWSWGYAQGGRLGRGQTTGYLAPGVLSPSLVRLIQFDSTLAGNGIVDSRVVLPGSALGTLALVPKTTDESLSFAGWYDDPVGGTQPTHLTVPDGHTTYYARWQKEGAAFYGSRVIAFDPQGGTGSKIKDVYNINDLLPTPPATTRVGHTLLGWFDEPIGGNLFNPSGLVEDDATYYAQWAINRYTVSFNSQGGSAQAARQVNHGAAIGALPVPSRAGHVFLGWWTLPSAGIQVSASTPATSPLVLHARWRAVPAPAPAPAPVVRSNNNRLNGLRLNRGKLTQRFSPSRATHTVRLTRTQTQVRITPTRAHSRARVQVRVGNTWRNAASHNIKVARGKTATVRFRVIAENGAIRNHSVRVQRAR